MLVKAVIDGGKGNGEIDCHDRSFGVGANNNDNEVDNTGENQPISKLLCPCHWQDPEFTSISLAPPKRCCNSQKS